MDLIGRFVYEYKQNKFIFLAIDYHNKWIETAVVNNKSGKNIAQIIEDLILKKHGIPEKNFTNNGLEFLHITYEI